MTVASITVQIFQTILDWLGFIIILVFIYMIFRLATGGEGLSGLGNLFGRGGGDESGSRKREGEDYLFSRQKEDDGNYLFGGRAPKSRENDTPTREHEFQHVVNQEEAKADKKEKEESKKAIEPVEKAETEVEEVLEREDKHPLYWVKEEEYEALMNFLKAVKKATEENETLKNYITGVINTTDYNGQNNIQKNLNLISGLSLQHIFTIPYAVVYHYAQNNNKSKEVEEVKKVLFDETEKQVEAMVEQFDAGNTYTSQRLKNALKDFKSIIQDIKIRHDNLNLNINLD